MLFRRIAVATALLAMPLASEVGALPIKYPHFDLQATGLEVVQSVQAADNSVRLVQGKPTWVRVYATHTSDKDLFFFPLVKTRLGATRIAPGPATFLGVLDQAAFVPDSVNFPRSSIPNSANFAIPASWRSGTVQFAAIVDFEEKFVEADDSNNTVIDTVTFETVPPVRMRLYQMDYPGGGLPTPADLSLLNSWLRRAFPTAAVDVEYRTVSSTINVTNDVCNCPRACSDQVNGGSCVGNPMLACVNDLQCGVDGTCNCASSSCFVPGTCSNSPGFACTSDTGCGCGRVNDWLTTQRNADQGSPNFAPDRRYVAMVHDVGGFMRGCSPGVDRKVASGPTGDPAGTSFSWDTDASYGDFYTAHELGHAYGLPHWTCCGATGDPKSPYPMCMLTSANEHLGVDLAIPKLYPGNQYTDVMAYCDFQWTSDITYHDLMNRLIAEGGAPPPPPSPPTKKFFVQGSANLVLGTASFGSILQLPAFAVAPTGGSVGDWEIRFEDTTGGMTSHFFTPPEYDDDHNFRPDNGRRFPGLERIASIAELIEAPPGDIVRVDLFQMGSLRDTRFASSNPPTVTLTFPNGGETLSGVPTTVTWTASDLDGDALESMLLYSTDAGSTWSSLAAGIEGNSTEIDPTTLAGSNQVLLRVLVSDGFHTASDDSDAVLEIPDSLPRVFIASPVDGSLRQDNEAVAFEAVASDPEDGMLTGTAIEWSSDRQGALGSGESIVVENLAPGTHLVTATATDSAAQSSSATIEVVVGDEDNADACEAAARVDCDTMGVTVLNYRDSSSPDRRRLVVSLKDSGQTHVQADFGTPGAGTSHTLCIYESGALESVLPLPDAAPWTAVSDRGYKFIGNGAEPVLRALLTAGSAAKPRSATLQVKAKGEGVPDLDPPVATPLTFQVVNDTTGVCFSGTWTSPRRNEFGLLKARD